MSADSVGLEGMLRGHRVGEDGGNGRRLGVCACPGKRLERRDSQPNALPPLAERQWGHATDHDALPVRRAAAPRRRSSGLLQGAVQDHLRAVPWHSDLRGVRQRRGVHFAGALPRGVKRGTPVHAFVAHAVFSHGMTA